MSIKIIVACSKNGVIGKGNKLPWHLPEDLKYFKKTTNNSFVIMGRKTWDSLPRKPLPNRENVVLSRKKKYEVIDHNLSHFYSSIGEILNDIKEQKLAHIPIWVIGGASIYFEFLDKDLVSEIRMTLLKDEYEGDTYFPMFDEILNTWHQDVLEEHENFKILRLKNKS